MRAKRKIRDAGHPLSRAAAQLLPERLDGVLRVLYLVFNEGYAASSGDALVRRELSAEAIRLARIVVLLLPDEPEALGLLALMLLHDARREARVGADGDLVLLEDQDRARWDAAGSPRAWRSSSGSLRSGRPGPYQLQAAIAALHDEAPDAGDDGLAADRRRCTRRCAGMDPSPVVGLNHAVAVAMADGPASAWRSWTASAAEGRSRLPVPSRRPRRPVAAARALVGAATAYRRALTLTANRAERSILQRRWWSWTGTGRAGAARAAAVTESP